MSDPRPSDYQYRFTADESTATKLAAAFLTQRSGRGLPLVALILCVALGVLLLIVGGVGRAGSLLGFGVFLIVLPAVLLGVTFLTTRARFHALTLAPGAEWAASYTATELHALNPAGASVVELSGYRSIAQRGEFVFLGRRADRGYTALPAQICPPEIVERIRGLIARR